MQKKYAVRWKARWWGASRFMVVTMLQIVVAVFAVRFFKTGMSAAETFRYVSERDAVLFAVGVVVISAVVGFLFSVMFRFCAVGLTHSALSGRNYLGQKNIVPLEAIKGISFRNNGLIEVLVVDGGVWGEIYVLASVEGFDELAGVLEKHVEQNNS